MNWGKQKGRQSPHPGASSPESVTGGRVFNGSRRALVRSCWTGGAVSGWSEEECGCMAGWSGERERGAVGWEPGGNDQTP